MEQRYNNQHLVQWWLEGGNELGIQIGWEKDEEEEDALVDLERFSEYCNTLRPDRCSEILQKLTSSNWSRALKNNLNLGGCFPRLYFREIVPANEEGYEKIVQEYGLEEFILRPNITVKQDIKNHKGKKSKPVYISFIKLGEFYIVNLIPSF